MLRRLLKILFLLWILTIGNCAPSIFPEKGPHSPVDPSWHAYKESYYFPLYGVPRDLAQVLMHEGIHTVLERVDGPTDAIDRLDESLRNLAQAYDLEYRREGATANLIFSTKPMTVRPKLPAAKDYVRGIHPKRYKPGKELARLLDSEPDLLVIVHGHGGDWFPNDHEVAVEFGQVLANGIRNLLLTVGMHDLDRVDAFGCDQGVDGTVVVTLISSKWVKAYEADSFPL